MVNKQKVLQRLGRGAAVGVGSLGAGRLQSEVANRQNFSKFAPAAVGLGVGLGASLGADTISPTRSGMVNDAIEFVGYGIQGASWENVGEQVMSEQQTQASGEVIEVTANATSSGYEESAETEDELFSVNA